MKRFAGLASAVALALVASACAETDAGVTTKVKAQLAADEMVKAYKVDVDTQEHVVTLSGEVETEAVKEQAVRIARNTEGVRDVVDDLTVVGTSGTIDPGGTPDRIEIKVDETEVEDKAEGLGRRHQGRRQGDRKRRQEGRRSHRRRRKGSGRSDRRWCEEGGRGGQDAVTDDDKDSDNDGK